MARPTVVDLSIVREEACVLTDIAAFLAEQAGADVRVVRPGLIEAVLPGAVVEVRVRMANVFKWEADAYRLAGLPVPAYVLEDIERWEREHGSRI
jgi:hypothetical protein